MEVLEHKHLIIRAEIGAAPKNVTLINEWMKNLIEKINMKILMGPYTKYSEVVGNRGMTSVAVIETSHIALHTWDECTPAMLQLDVYTCSTVTPEQVIAELEFFRPTKVEYKFLDRENDLTLINKDIIIN